MRGQIVKRKLKSGVSYSVVLYLGKDDNGKKKYRWFAANNYTDAKDKLKELLKQADTGSLMTSGKTSVKEFLNKWLDDYCTSNLSPRGLDRYRGICEKYFIPQFGNLLLTKLSPEVLQRHYGKCLTDGLTNGTVRYHAAVIHKALKTALEWGLVTRNIADVVKPPRKSRKEMSVWNEEEIKKFLDTAQDSPYYTLFFLALYSGMRRSELLALTWNDIDLANGQISVKRGLHQLRNGKFVYGQCKSVKSRRTIALPQSALIQLKLFKEKIKLQCSNLDLTFKDDRLVFCKVDGKEYRPNTITRAWEVLADRAGVKVIRLHDARHSHASMLLKAGVHPKVVQERLGHSSIDITLDIYSHVAPGMQEAAAAQFDKMLNTPLATVQNQTE